MTALATPRGRQALLNAAFGGRASLVNAIRIKLFKNNFTPLDSSVIADFTECDFDGYADFLWAGDYNQVVSGADFSVQLIDTTGSYPYPIRFTAGAFWTTPQTAYGWYCVFDGPLTGAPLFCGRFGSPVLVTAPGDTVPLIPSITDRPA